MQRTRNILLLKHISNRHIGETNYSKNNLVNVLKIEGKYREKHITSEIAYVKEIADTVVWAVDRLESCLASLMTQCMREGRKYFMITIFMMYRGKR